MHEIESYACLKMLYFTGYIDGHINSSHCLANEKNPFSSLHFLPIMAPHVYCR